LKTIGITLVSHGRFEKDFLERLAHDVRLVFGKPVLVEQFHHDIASYFEPARKQYDANRLLHLVHTEYATEGIKTMGLFRVDLFIPILTYIFGQAQYKGNAGIASVFRLRNEQYGMKGNDQLLYERFRKVIIHELGHTFGLIHCHVPICVM
jgi:archaemetzincin